MNCIVSTILLDSIYPFRFIFRQMEKFKKAKLQLIRDNCI